MRRAPSHASIQTQRMLGFTSQKPALLTPPQGPFRKPFGQFMGQAMPVERSVHSPHIRQSKSNPLITRSMLATGFSTRS